MPYPDYFITFDQYKNSSLSDFAEILKRLPRKAVGTIQLAELCSMAEYPNGLYLFFADNNELQYVGKSTSRSFIERIPSHFDQRHDAWFNTLPKRIMAVSKIEDYADAHTLGLSFGLVLIGVKSKATARKLESVLRSFLQPVLNAGEKGRFVGTERLAAYETYHAIEPADTCNPVSAAHIQHKTSKDDAMPESIEAIIRGATSPNNVQVTGCLTDPPSFGVYMLPVNCGTTRYYRFGNYPIRGQELERKFGPCTLKYLFLLKADAMAVTSWLNANDTWK